jgi:hypothetical protein
MILASVITYELSKRIGRQKAAELFQTEAAATVSVPGEKPCCQAVNVVRRLRKFSEVGILHDAGGTSIGHARSRAFSLALQYEADIWISIDDDTEADAETLAHLVAAIDPETPQIVIVPCWLRQDTPVVNVTLDPSQPLERVSKTGARLRRALYGGFGIVAVSRAAVREIAHHWRDLIYVDDDATQRLGVFCEYIRSGVWFREDYAFFSRVPEHVRIEALLTGMTDHDGKKLRLETAEQNEMIPLPMAFARRDTEPPPAASVEPDSEAPPAPALVV